MAIDFNDKSWLTYLDEKVWEYLPSSSLKSRNGSEITFRCPFCGDSKKNRTKKRGYYYRKTGSFYCFNCEEHGTGLKLLKQICSENAYDQIIKDYKVLNFNRMVGGKKNAEIEESKSEPFEILSPSPSWKYLLDYGWSRPQQLSESALARLDERIDRKSVV